MGGSEASASGKFDQPILAGESLNGITLVVKLD
jgi:hypothetical protein